VVADILDVGHQTRAMISGAFGVSDGPYNKVKGGDGARSEAEAVMLSTTIVVIDWYHL
jgi:hypothetical protein